MNTLPPFSQDDNPILKKCSQCPNSYPATERFFHKRKGTRDGLRADCKLCTAKRGKQYYRENKDEMNKKHKEYLETNKEAIYEQKRQHYASNKEKILLQQKEYYKNNKLKARESRRAYYNMHRDEFRDYMKEYRKKNLHDLRLKERDYSRKNKDRRHVYMKTYRQTEHGKIIKRVLEQKRRAQKKSVGGYCTAQQLKDQLKRQKSKCYWCHKKLGKSKGPWHADHVVPLSKGGSNSIDNIVIACPSCNLKKGAKLVHEWTEGGRLL